MTKPSSLDDLLNGLLAKYLPMEQQDYEVLSEVEKTISDLTWVLRDQMEGYGCKHCVNTLEPIFTRLALIDAASKKDAEAQKKLANQSSVEMGFILTGVLENLQELERNRKMLIPKDRGLLLMQIAGTLHRAGYRIAELSADSKTEDGK